jgi:hypothetical protein
MTDALAAWALTETERGRDPWTWLRALESNENALGFEPWIAEMRATDRLENDDVGFLHLRFGAKDA